MRQFVSFLSKNRLASALSVFAMMMALSSSVFAADEGIDPSVVTGAVSDAVKNVLAMFSGLLPLALAVFAATWGIRKAIRFFKASSN